MAEDSSGLVLTTYNRARIDYRSAFVLMYASFNSWYRYVTGSRFDSRAVGKIQDMPVMWVALFDDQADGSSMSGILRRLYYLTNAQSNPGEYRQIINDPYDWKGLISLWYRVRCQVVHGEPVAECSTGELIVKYCYESLNIFMLEVIRRQALASECLGRQLPHEAPSEYFQKPIEFQP
ncbi:hypothetical protein B7Y94_02225 [Candidatus Saccharibacteria bacterium 32-49-12]|nr:MAG: hypothetical protein B7Y94_02225 [Candidatus Saccharibacteria bacterium 32-49-12]